MHLLWLCHCAQAPLAMPMLGSHLLRQPLPEARLEATQSHLHLVCSQEDHQPAARDDFTCLQISEN